MDAANIPAELAALLRAGRALAVHASDGSGIFSGGAATVDGFVPDAALSRHFAGLAASLPISGATVLADLPLSGSLSPKVPAGCRLLTSADGQRALLIIPVAPWQHRHPAPRESAELGKASATDPLRDVKAAMQFHLAADEIKPDLNSDVGRAPPREAARVTNSGATQAEDGGPVRVLWQSDADGRIMQVGSRLINLVGAQSGAILGQRWQDLAGDLFIDSSGALGEALAARATANKIPLLWSVDDAPGPVEVDWSALPVMDGSGEFRGLRGFLLVHAAPVPVAQDSHADATESVTPDAPKTGKSQPSSPASLSQSERLAFRELARALAERSATERAEPDADLEPLSNADAAQHSGTAALVETVEADLPEATPQVALQSEEPDTSADIADDLTAQLPSLPEIPAGGLAEDVDPENGMADGQIAAVADLASQPQPDPVIIPTPVTHIVRVPDPRYLDIIERLPVGVLISRAERALFANRTLLDLLDYDSLADIETAGGTPAIFKGRIPLSEREGPSGPILLCARDGERISVDARLQNMHWDGEPATLVSFRRSADIELGQKLRAAESEVKSREAQLRETRAILDTTTDGVAVLDEAGRILSINRTAEALFGYEQKEVVGEPVTELIAPESRNSVLDYFEGLKSGGVRSVLNDGREITARVRQGGRMPVFLSFGQITEKPERKFCAVMRDLTAWKKSERDLIDARKAAEAASAQKSDFLAKISHEVRTPLNAIIGFAEVMMEERFGPIGNDRYKDYLKDIHESGGHVISLVNDLLDLSKIEAGKMELDFTSVNINEIVRSTVSLMQPQSQRGRIVIRSAMTTKLPPVIADERALKQIVLNLLSNAVKFTDPGGQVIVSTTQSDLGEVAIRVRDTGIGMTPKEVEQAMEPFKQLSATRRTGGTGLGLPLTKALVEANRAAMRISSVKNEGTLVEIVFPPTRVMAAQS